MADTKVQESPGAPPEPRRNRRGRVVRLLAFLVVPGLFVAMLALGLFRSVTPRAVVGSPAPEFDLPLLEGGGTVSSAGLEGSPVVVNFWASWCLPCREEAPALERAWRQYRDRGVVVLGVNVQDEADDAAGFVREFGITYPVVRDPSLAVATRFGVRGLPETFFVDHRWRFSAVGAGERVGKRGSTVVLGAVPAAVLRSEIEAMVGRMEEEARGTVGPPPGP